MSDRLRQIRIMALVSDGLAALASTAGDEMIIRGECFLTYKNTYRDALELFSSSSLILSIARLSSSDPFLESPRVRSAAAPQLNVMLCAQHYTPFSICLFKSTSEPVFEFDLHVSCS